MEEVFRTTDSVKLSYVRHLLNEANIQHYVADEHMAAIHGDISAFPRRVLVEDGDASRAKYALKEVEPG